MEVSRCRMAKIVVEVSERDIKETVVQNEEDQRTWIMKT